MLIKTCVLSWPHLRLRFIHEELGGPTRYRVHNHVEQARLAGLQAEALPLASLGRRLDLRGVDLLYLHRLRLTTQTLPLLIAARLRRVPMVYDSDDLIWDRRIRQYEQLDQRHSPATVRQILAEVRRARWLMSLCDALVLSTPYLAAQARATFRRPVFVHENALATEVIAQSEAAWRSRRHGDTLAFAHFSGTRGAHDADLAQIAAALRATLDAFPAARLLLVGDSALPAALAAAPYATRVQRQPPVAWHALPALIATVAVNLAPLLDNPQRRAKSAVKFLEAAAVGVPTLAARLDPYAETIRDGVTGLLAASPEEWVMHLGRLATDPVLRRSLGSAAREHVLAAHTATARAPMFHKLIERILATHKPR